MPAEFIVYPALVLAILVTLNSYIVLRRQQYDLGEPMGKGEWNFSESWATNVTIIGSLFCTIVAQYSNDKQKYAGLSIFFGVLIVLAPFVYNTLSRSHTMHTPDGGAEVQYLSPLWAFLLSVTLTLWAVFGQLATEISFLVSTANPVSTSVYDLLIIFMVLGVVLAAIHSFRTIVRTVHEQVSPTAKLQRAQALYDNLAKSGNSVTTQRPPHELRPEQPRVRLL